MTAIHGTYNYWLVALSFAIAILTSYTAVDLSGRITANQGGSRNTWLLGGAVAMGSGIWCMHYIGMLAFQLNIPVYYHLPTVALSLVAAILASLVALYSVSLEVMSRARVALGSVLMGASIAAMHYIGMAAMRMNAMHVYRPSIWIASVLLAVAISYIGLTLLLYVKNDSWGHSFNLAVPLILGLAIPAMHYTGMAAVSFRSMNESVDYTNSIDISFLANIAILTMIVLILGFALITSLVDRKLSEQQLTLEGERKMLRALIDHIPDCMYVKDRDGRYILANTRMAETVGLSDPQAMLGKTDFDLFPYNFANKFREDELRSMNFGTPLFEHEELSVNKSGGAIPMLTTKVPLRGAKGQVTGIAGIGRDISERKKSELALRDAEQKYRSMFDEAPVGIFQLDPASHLVQVNPVMAQLLGYTDPQEMLTCAIGPLWVPAGSDERHNEFVSLMKTVGYVRAFELEVLRKDGSSIWVSASVSTKMEQQTFVGYVGMYEDITERRALREQLLQAQKLESVGQLAAGIAHEINTPVQYIGDNVRFLQETFADLALVNEAYAGLLLANQTDGVTQAMMINVSEAVRRADVDYIYEEIPKAIEQTLDGVSRVAKLVAAMKEFSHPGTGQKVPLDINHAIESTTVVARNEWKYISDMQLSLDTDLPLVNCLPGEFNQVILNLIVNAAHAIVDVANRGGAAKGLITIETRSLEGSIEVRVQDTGGGIPEKVRARIFDPFFTTKEIGKGTGQGLAIARSVIVDKHQGSLTFETVEGLGTTFIIKLPCEEARASLQEVAA